jgi:hypothetical protein
LIDLKLSQTASPDSLIFLRPVSLPEIVITSGFLLPFQAETKDHLLEVHQKVMNKTDSRPESARRFYIFYQMHEKYGIPSQVL